MSKSFRQGPGHPPMVKAICQGTKGDGEPCKREVALSERYCWQHSKGFRHRWRSLTRNQGIFLALAIASIILTLVLGIPGIYWHFSVATGNVKPPQQQPTPSGATTSDQTPQPSRPFAVTLGAPMIAENPAFWKLNGPPKAPLLCPGRVLLYLALTNQETVSAMVNRLKIAIKKVDGKWENLAVVEPDSDSLLYMGPDTRKVFAYEGNFLDLKLKGYNFRPGETVSGWLMLDYPLTHIPNTVIPEFKLEISDMTMNSSPEILLPTDTPLQEPALVVASGYQNLSKAEQAKSCADWSD